METEVEWLKGQLEKYKQIDSEWLRAARKYLCSPEEKEQAEGLRELDELRIGNSWTEMAGEPVLKTITEQRDQALKELRLLKEAISRLCQEKPEQVPVLLLMDLLKGNRT